MTALVASARWDPPGPGLWLRNFRLGEWLPDPVTPLFADWLLNRIDQGFQQAMRDTARRRDRLPVRSGEWLVLHPAHFVTVGVAQRHRQLRGGILPFVVNALIRPGRDPAAADRALLGGLYRQWRDDLLPAYQEASRSPTTASRPPTWRD